MGSGNSQNDLVERTRFMESLLNLTPGILYIYDVVERKNVFTNEGIQDILGYSSEELRGMGDQLLPLLVHPDDMTNYVDNIYAKYATVADGEKILNQYRMKNKGGQWRWISSTEIIYQRQADGSAKQMIGIGLDITEQKTAQLALQEVEERVRRSMDQMLEGCQLIGFDWRFLYLNEAAAHQGRMPKEAFLGRAIQEVLPGIEDTELFVAMKQVMESRKPQHLENEFRYSDGTAGWFELSIQPVEEGIFLLSIDVTDRKKTEAALRDSEEILSEFVRHSPIYAFIKEVEPTESRVVIASDNYSDMIGISGREMTGKTMGELFPPEFAEKITADDWNVASRNEILRLDEELGDNSYTTIKFPIHKGDRILLAGYTIDITERKQAEAKLQVSKNLLAQTEQIGHVGGWEVDLETRRQTWTEEVYRIHEVEPDFDPTVEKGLSFYTDESRPIIENAVQNAIEHGKAFDVELEIVTAKGNRKFVHAIGNADPIQRKVRGFFQDITSRKATEEVLRRLNRELQAISDCNQVLMRVTDEQALLQEICRIVCEVAGYAMAWVGYAVDDETKSVKPMAWAGREEGYLATANISWADTERGRGPTGRALRTGMPTYSSNLETDPHVAPWKTAGLQRGYHSILSLPLKDDAHQSFGILTIYANHVDAFTQEEIDLLEKLAGDLAFGIRTLRARRERNLVTKELRETKAILQAALDQSPAGIAIADAPSGLLRYVNDAGLLIRGGDRKSIVEGVGIQQYVASWQLLDVDGRTLGMDEVPLARAVQFGEASSREFIVRRNDNDDRVVLARAAPIFDEQGATMAAIVVFMDITEKKLSQRAVEESEERLRFAMETSHIGAWDLDTLDHTAFRSLEHDRIFGYPELLPSWTFEMFMEHVHPEDRERVGSQFQQAIETKGDWNFQCRIRRLDGEVRWIWAAGRHSPAADKSLTRLAGIVQDITEQKLAQVELEQHRSHLQELVQERTKELEAAIHELESFSYSVSHDLRSPLRHLNGFVRLLKTDFSPSLSEEAKRYLDVIAASATHMGNLIDVLLRFAHTSRQDMRKLRVDLNQVVQEARKVVSQGVLERRIDWEVEDLPGVIGDFNLLGLAWVNLLENAVKYTGKQQQAQIKIRCKDLGNEFLFSVQDNGVGFDMAYADNLFGVFQRLHRNEEFEGMGIGLATVQRIIVRHDGRIWADSAVGSGATFFFTLPKREWHEKDIPATASP